MVWICVASTASLLLAVLTVITSSVGQDSATLWQHLWLLGSAATVAGSFLWMVNQRLIQLTRDEWSRRIDQGCGARSRLSGEDERGD